MAEYYDYASNNGDRYYLYTTVGAIINEDGTPFTNWMASMNIHNHDDRYALGGHNHDNDYSKLTHNHDTEYAKLTHTHLFAGAETEGGSALSAIKLDTTTNVVLDGAITGSFSFDGTNNSITVHTEVGHNHDREYITLNGNSDMVLDDESSKAFEIHGDKTNTKVIFDVGTSNKATIALSDTAFSFFYGADKLEISDQSITFNSETLTTKKYVDDTVKTVVDDAVSQIDTSIHWEEFDKVYSKLTHEHTYSEIKDTPKHLPNEFPLTITVGDSNKILTYDGSEAVTETITLTDLGGAKANHTHDYTKVFASISHNHDSEYMKADGSTTYPSHTFELSPFNPNEFTEEETPGIISETEGSITFPLPKDYAGTSGTGRIGANYRYAPDTNTVSITNVFMGLGEGLSATYLRLYDHELCLNEDKIFHQGFMGVGSGLDAEKLAGRNIDNLPYLSGKESFIDSRDENKTGNIIYNNPDGVSIETFESGESLIKMSAYKDGDDYVYGITLTESEMAGNDVEVFSIRVNKVSGVSSVNIPMGTLTVNGKAVLTE